jgi:hypothetical protein
MTDSSRDRPRENQEGCDRAAHVPSRRRVGFSSGASEDRRPWRRTRRATRRERLRARGRRSAALLTFTIVGGRVPALTREPRSRLTSIRNRLRRRLNFAARFEHRSIGLCLARSTLKRASRPNEDIGGILFSADAKPSRQTRPALGSSSSTHGGRYGDQLE